MIAVSVTSAKLAQSSQSQNEQEPSNSIFSKVESPSLYIPRSLEITANSMYTHKKMQFNHEQMLTALIFNKKITLFSSKTTSLWHISIKIQSPFLNSLFLSIPNPSLHTKNSHIHRAHLKKQADYLWFKLHQTTRRKYSKYYS